MDGYMLLDIAMILLVVTMVLVRCRYTRVAATPLNLFAVMSLAMLFVTYPLLSFGLNAIGWGGISDIVNGARTALLICSLGTTLFFLSSLIAPTLMYSRTSVKTASKTDRPHRRIEHLEAYAAAAIALTGAACLWVVFIRTGIVPLLAEIPSRARTFSSNLAVYQSIRPIYQAGYSLAGTSSSFVIAWYLCRRRHAKSPLPILASLCVVLVTLAFTANRGWLLLPILNGTLIYFAINWQRIRLWKVARFGFLLITAALALQIVRSGSFTARRLAYIPIEFASGNTFCDFRDFSWLVTEFHRKGYEHFDGKTILAGYMGFVPSSVSRFREQYAWGRVSADIAGLNPDKMFGLRPGPFGEWYFNFGWIGVIVHAILLGLVAGNLDYRLIRSVKQPDQVLYQVFVNWTLFSIICGPLILSSAGPAVLPNLVALVGIRLLAIFLRDAGMAGRALRVSSVSPCNSNLQAPKEADK